MIQINLLPDLKKEFIKSQKTKGLVVASSILVTLCAIGLSLLLFVYVNFGQQFQINLITGDIKQKADKLAAIPGVDQYLTVQNQLTSIPQLHDQKGNYSRLFNFLKVLNPNKPNNVNLSRVQLTNADKSVTLTGTSGSFEALNVFIDTLKNAKIKYQVNGTGDPIEQQMFAQVFTQDSGLGKVSDKIVVSFTVRVIYNDAVFDTRNTNVEAQVPNITTTTSVTGAPIPDQLFNDSQPEDQ